MPVVVTNSIHEKSHETWFLPHPNYLAFSTSWGQMELQKHPCMDPEYRIIPQWRWSYTASISRHQISFLLTINWIQGTTFLNFVRNQLFYASCFASRRSHLTPLRRRLLWMCRGRQGRIVFKVFEKHRGKTLSAMSLTHYPSTQPNLMCLNDGATTTETVGFHERST